MRDRKKSNKGTSPGNIVVSPEDIPKRCFVSHSWEDAGLVKKLRRSVPDNVRLESFPRAEPDSGKSVSNEIIQKILDCPGLIYLASGASSRYFCVTFERDYAPRAGRKVIAYSPDDDSFRLDRSPPMPLDLTVMFHSDDETRVHRLIDWMARERHFRISETNLRSTTGSLTGNHMVAMEELLMAGGLVLWLAEGGTVDLTN